MGQICFFVGHRDAPASIYPALVNEVKRHIELGVVEFRVGHYGAFDRMAVKAVREAKRYHPGVTLYLALPYLPENGRKLPEMENYDGSIYPEGMENVPYQFAISRLNRYMVQKADYVIAYVVHPWGGAAATLNYARIRERKGLLSIYNIPDMYGIR